MYQIEQTIDDIEKEGRSQLDIMLGEDDILRISPDNPSAPQKELVPTTRGVCI